MKPVSELTVKVDINIPTFLTKLDIIREGLEHIVAGLTELESQEDVKARFVDDLPWV
ncbi:hypothetical protein V1498_10100 [Peribacillus sp. SCS-26]|uniref:hypothetical protein n=1 Tax=Paraperibacillus marinus TaxID=3115295 RepID=UPI003906BAF6